MARVDQTNGPFSLAACPQQQPVKQLEIFQTKAMATVQSLQWRCSEPMGERW